MTTRSIQVSIDEELLERIDLDCEAARCGRSAFFRAAASCYLAAKEKREIDESIAAACRHDADSMLDELVEFMDSSGGERAD